MGRVVPGGVPPRDHAVLQLDVRPAPVIMRSPDINDLYAYAVDLLRHSGVSWRDSRLAGRQLARYGWGWAGRQRQESNLVQGYHQTADSRAKRNGSSEADLDVPAKLLEQ